MKNYISRMKRKPKTTSEWIAVILVGVLSLIHLITHISGGWDFSFINTIIGIAFVVCFLRNIPVYKTLLLMWALLQTIEIQFPIGKYILDFNQVFDFALGFTMRFKTGFMTLGVGLAGIFYTGLAIKVKMDSLYGSVVKLKSFKKDSYLNEFLPADGIVMKRVTIGDDNSWFVVELIGKEHPKYGLIKGKEDYMIRKGKNQIVQFMKVEDPQWVFQSGILDKSILKTGAWAVVE
jgi:hypothetical protein